jgi:hypothetical protein
MVALSPAASAQTPDLSRLVVVGDSLSAGVQNLALLDTQQPNGYASLVARQAGVPLVLPLIKFPGLPNVLQLTGSDSEPVVQAVPGPPAVPARHDPTVQATDLAEPGIPVVGALLPPAMLTAPVGAWATAVLESSTYPNAQLSQVQEAMALKPSTVILWLGNNDALVPALVGAISTLTPISQADATNPNPLANFTGAFQAVIGSLASTGATLVVANIPDVTEIAFFTPVSRIPHLPGRSSKATAAALGTGSGDYLRMSAMPLAMDILAGKTKGPLPAVCPSPYTGFPAPAVPCVLTAADAAIVRAHVNGYNAAIAAAVAALPRATLVDVHSLVQQITANGYRVDGHNLNSSLLGGLFTLDGIHPTNTSYALIANRFIDTMNAKLHTSIPAVDVAEIAKHDPLIFGKGKGKDKEHDF